MGIPQITANCLIRITSEKRFPNSLLIISGFSTLNDRGFFAKNY